MKARPCKIINSKGYVECTPEEATYLELNIPGPTGMLVLPVMIGGTRKGTNNLTWNGSVDMPTLKPSVLTTGHNFKSHSWINNGKIQFLSDSDHNLANQTVDLLDII